MVKKLKLIALISLVHLAFVFADNSICSNTDESLIGSAKCLSFEEEFVQTSEEWPKYGNGEKFPEEGTACFGDNNNIYDFEKGNKFSRSGIRYVIVSPQRYCCNFEVFPTTETRWGIDFSSGGNYGTFYFGCDFQEDLTKDTIFDATSKCSNTDEALIGSEKCLSSGDKFVQTSEGWPKYGDGKKKPKEGTTCFGDIYYPEKEFTRNGIRYAIVSLKQFCCKHQVFQTEKTMYGIDFSPGGKYGTLYFGCDFQDAETMDTVFAITPVCSNTDESLIGSEMCYSFGNEFVLTKEKWPKYSDGEEMQEEGSACWDDDYIYNLKKGKKFSRNGIRYAIVSPKRYCCQYKVFQTAETTYGDVDFSPGGNYGIFYSDCYFQDAEKKDTVFDINSLQQPLDELDVINMLGNFSESFGNEASALVKLAGAQAMMSSMGGETPFKIYRKNKTLKYIGGVNMGICFSKNGKKILDFVRGPQYCKQV